MQYFLRLIYIVSSFTNNTKNLLNAYFSTQGSTTLFLHDIAKAPVQVRILKQKLCDQYLFRESLLYIDNVTYPALYARCLFYRKQLSTRQIEQLMNSLTPVGVVLGIDQLSKQNQQLTRSIDEVLKRRLNVTDECCERSFDLYRGNTKVANLTETVSHQSLQRLVDGDKRLWHLAVGQ